MLSNEDKILLLLASPIIDEDKINDILPNINLDNIINKAKKYKVIPIVYYNLKKLNIEDNNLELEYKKNIAKNILLLEELKNIVKILNENNIEVIVFKGVELINTIYPTIGTRYLSDLDILIKRENLKRVDGLFKQNGYCFHFTNRATHNIYKKEVAVEVHWNLINNWIPPERYAFQLNLNNIWQNRKLKNYNDVWFYTLSEEDLLIYLCCHIIKEYFFDIKWLEDIAGVVKYYSLNWDNIIEKVSQQKVRKTVYLSLWLLKNVLEIDIPEYVLIKLNYKNDNLENFIVDNLLNPLQIYKKRLFLYLSIIDNNYDKFKAVIGILPYIIKRGIYY